jgi:acetylornithine deacetylase/succinyl-diaminopimelate desuccinylase-like protein
MNDPRQLAQARQAQHVSELIDFLRIPSVSTQPQHAADVAAAARWLAAQMTAAGLEHGRVIATAGHPLVYADWLHAGRSAHGADLRPLRRAARRAV